jgi:acyl carrier protein
MAAPVRERVRRIISDMFAVPIDQVTDESSPDTIEAWDSMAHLNLVLSLEQEFAITFDLDEIAELTSVPAIVDRITSRIA